jgi:hypothetical protein
LFHGRQEADRIGQKCRHHLQAGTEGGPSMGDKKPGTDGKKKPKEKDKGKAGGKK